MPSDYQLSELHRLLIEELEDFAVFLIDREGRIISWNPGVERFFGFTEEDFVGRNFADIFTPEDRAKGAPAREMEKAAKEGRSDDVRWHLCQDQTRVFVEGVLLRVQNQNREPVGFAKIARAVRQMHAAGSMLATLLERTGDAIYAIDREDRFVFANERMARLLNRDLDNVIGQTREHLLPPDFAAQLRASDEDVIRGGRSRPVEERFPDSGSGERVMLTAKSPWKDTEGRLIGLVAIAQDITERTAYQTERERLLEEIRRSNEALSTFSHVVAHDLRAPLRAVKVYTDLLERHLRAGVDETAREYMAFVKDGADHMEQLIESLLRYAESGEELSLQRVDTNALIENLRNMLAPIIQESGARVLSDPLPEVYADPLRLLQVFQNLIMNAINYCGSEPPRIQISAAVSDTEYRFSLSDNGIGIAPGDRERIFSPLQRLHAKDVPGSGIGLALCRKIIERHGGRIWVESTPGQGSTFLFTLPARTAAEAD
ncbi:MAG TPA: PAS domain-containing protein [Bryobacteraceae bacterium]|jgi:PAS domain S-box-containing protein|nr:PAS domain-containing protein [Bryobacteraceae bacterium]